MVLVLALALLALLGTWAYLISYRRQIREICRQISFLNSHDTNWEIRTDRTEKEILKLAAAIEALHQEQKNRAQQSKERENRLKEALTSVSHDIRTPLTSLKGYFQLLSEEEEPKKRKEYGAVMQERMNTLAALLEELFTFTKLQNDTYRLELSRLNVTGLVLETLFSFYEEMKEKGISPELDISEEAVFLLCNETALKRVISNIVRNALVHGDGRLRIFYGTVGKASIKGDSAKKGFGERPAVLFRCENNLAHPEEIDMERVFEYFYKADAARSSHSSGLGLAIAKELVQRMDGEIEARLQDDTFQVEVRFYSKRIK